jgi:autotransporter-associated beta strand protein
LTNVSDGGSAFGITKAGGGTLALAGANNTYSGATNVNGGTLMVNGTLPSPGGAVSINTAAVLTGGGTINRDVNINALGTLKPGASPGKLTVGGNVTMAANSIYYWELAANTTGGPGTSWSQLQMTSGDLNAAAQPNFVPAFTGTATLPSSAVPFWQTTQQWNHIVDLTGTATNLSNATTFVINNSVWASAGNFTTIPGTTPGSIALLWTPVPEPLHILLIGGLATLSGSWIRRRIRARRVTSTPE